MPLYKPPSFQFYPTDFIAATSDLTPEEVGAYWRLLCRQWDEGGIPSDMDAIARITGVAPKRVGLVWKIIGRFFEPSPEAFGELVQPRMERVRADALAFQQRQVENGKRGGRPPKDGNPSETQTKGSVIYGLTQTEAKKSSPVSYLLSPSYDSLRSSALKAKKWPEAVDDLAALAAVFLAAFGNCTDPLKVPRHLPAYTNLLATMRSRAVPLEQAWKACEDALKANGMKPLFASSVKAAISYLPARSAAPGQRVANYEELS